MAIFPALRSRDFYAGLLFVLFGALALVISRSYPQGTAMQMGPGYFPTILGWLLSVLGTLVAVRGLVSRRDPVPGGHARCLLVLVAVIAFGLAIEPLGLVLSTAALIFIGAAAGRDFRIGEVTLLYVALTLLSVVVFIYGVGVQFSVGPA